METTFQGLEITFQKLEMILVKISENAIRDTKYDLTIFSSPELRALLESKLKKNEKKRILLTQIGYLRINIFNECYKRAQLAEETQKFDEAIKTMNRYVEEVAIQFLQERLHPSVSNRIKKLFFSPKLADAADTLQEWKLSLSKWTNINFDDANQEQTIQLYKKIKELFITLDMLSFSLDNFPPLATESAH